jgi:hypothetical protein
MSEEDNTRKPLLPPRPKKISSILEKDEKVNMTQSTSSLTDKKKLPPVPIKKSFIIKNEEVKKEEIKKEEIKETKKEEIKKEKPKPLERSMSTRIQSNDEKINYIQTEKRESEEKKYGYVLYTPDEAEIKESEDDYYERKNKWTFTIDEKQIQENQIFIKKQNLKDLNTKASKIQMAFKRRKSKKLFKKMIQNDYHRKKVQYELLETETKYVKDLKVLVEVFSL